jgi:hypothetical protein
LSDTKAGILLDISGLVIAILFQFEKEEVTEISKVLLLITGVILGISSFFSVMAVLPRSNRYAEEVMKFKVIDDFISFRKKLAIGQELEEYLTYAYDLAYVQSQKFRYIKSATIAIMIDIEFLVASFFFFFVMNSRR